MCLQAFGHVSLQRFGQTPHKLSAWSNYIFVKLYKDTLNFVVLTFIILS